MRRSGFWYLCLVLALAGCSRTSLPADRPVLRLATTTSTYDSGLLGELLPDFEEESGARVDVIAVGTGQALEIGKSGDVDVVLVHNRPLEEAFIAEGHGVERIPVMFNDFVLVGPEADPAGIAEATTGAEALVRILDTSSLFVSRADDSGTYARELLLWQASGVAPDLTDAWYMPIGQGMAETLQFAEERLAYSLSDRGTYLSLIDNLPDLRILFGGDSLARNPDPDLWNLYGVIQVAPEDPRQAQAALAAQFVDWLTSLETQERIAEYGIERYGQPLFYPASPAWCQAQGSRSPGCDLD